MSAARIWYSIEADYIGATGISSLDEMVTLLYTNDYFFEIMGLDADVMPWDVKEYVEKHIDVIKVPASTFRCEYWDNSHVIPIGRNDKPGRGYVKVWGIHV